MVSDDQMGLSTEDAAPGGADQLASVATPDRYVLLQPLGHGGTAIVYTAYDRQLDRKIAVKVLRGGHGSQARLLREAQALAKLRHPNVVTVYDAGPMADKLFVAMELVEGSTLRAWLLERPRSWREIVGVFVLAGRGLAAAHAEGLVHRDFKPDNVLCGKDGSVRVADFGLARLAAEVPGADHDGPLESSPMALELTRTGGVVGTPRYMSPEQHAGALIDARADQFGFCVALWDALFRHSPFDGGNHEELAAAIAAGKLREPPVASRVPKWLTTALRRGLATRPEDRWPSMDTLLAELGRDRGKLFRRGGMVAIIGVTAAALVLGFTREPGPPPCRDAAAQLDGVWDPGTGMNVHSAFLASGQVDAEDTYQRVAAHLDDYRQRWIAMRTEVCEASAVHHTQSEALLDRRVACLDKRKNALHALTGLLGGKLDSVAVEHATEAAGKLEDLSGCADAEALMAEVPPSRDPRMAGLELEIANADALHYLGHYAEAEAIGLDLVAEAPTINDLPTRTRALFALPQLVQSHGEISDAMKIAVEAATRQGLESAAAAHMFVEEADRWPTLMWVLIRRGRAAEAIELEPAAAAAAARVGRPASRLQLEQVLAYAFQELGKNEEALLHAQEALRLSDSFQDNPLVVASSLSTLGHVLSRLSRFDEARATMLRRIAICEAVLGPNHPEVADGLADLADVDHASLSHLDESRTILARALAIHERVSGVDSTDALDVVSQMGSIATAEERYEDAITALQRVLVHYDRAASTDRALLISVLVNLAAAEAQLGDFDAAVLHLERAGKLTDSAFPAGSPQRGIILIYRAYLDLRLGRLVEAEAEIHAAMGILDKPTAEGPPEDADTQLLLAAIITARGHAALALEPAARAVAINEKNGGKDSLPTADSLYVQGDALLAAGHVDAALAALERAEAIRAVHGMDRLQRGRTRFTLARARWAKGDREGAHAAAASALTDFTAAKFGKDLAAEVTAWTAQHA